MKDKKKSNGLNSPQTFLKNDPCLEASVNMSENEGIPLHKAVSMHFMPELKKDVPTTKGKK